MLTHFLISLKSSSFKRSLSTTLNSLKTLTKQESEIKDLGYFKVNSSKKIQFTNNKTTRKTNGRHIIF